MNSPPILPRPGVTWLSMIMTMLIWMIMRILRTNSCCHNFNIASFGHAFKRKLPKSIVNCHQVLGHPLPHPLRHPGKTRHTTLLDWLSVGKILKQNGLKVFPVTVEWKLWKPTKYEKRRESALICKSLPLWSDDWSNVWAMINGRPLISICSTSSHSIRHIGHIHQQASDILFQTQLNPSPVKSYETEILFQRTKGRVYLMIITVWTVSLLICSPPLMGEKPTMIFYLFLFQAGMTGQMSLPQTRHACWQRRRVILNCICHRRHNCTEKYWEGYIVQS